MLTLLSAQDAIQTYSPKEGDVYKELHIQGSTFKILYGYYEDFERHSQFNDPIPIYPDFTATPMYTSDGIPFATAMQDICSHFSSSANAGGETCLDCCHFGKYDDLIGLCNCPHTKRRASNNQDTP